MKKLLLLPLLCGTFLFGDIFSDLKVKEKNTFNYLNKTYPIDKTCSMLDLKKFLLIQEDLLENKKSKKFYLDLCDPFKTLYSLNKDTYNKINLSLLGKAKYKNLIHDYPNSFYINFYAYIFSKESGLNPDIKYDIFKVREDEHSKYINIYSQRKIINRKTEQREKYLPKIYKEGQFLLKSKHNSLYLSASSDMAKYLKKYKKEKAIEFLNYRIKENLKRGLNNKYLYMDLAEFKFNETYLTDNFNKEEIEGLILKSYSDGKLDTQTKLYMKIQTREHYLKLVSTYPTYIKNIEEYDILTNEIKTINKFSLGVSDKNYYYLAKLNVFVYEKMIYLKNKEKYRKEFTKNLRRAIRTEPDFREKRKMTDKIYAIEHNNFFKM